MSDTREVILRIAARHTNRKALEVLAKEVAPAATSMAPGITGGVRTQSESLCNFVYEFIIGFNREAEDHGQSPLSDIAQLSSPRM